MLQEDPELLKNPSRYSRKCLHAFTHTLNIQGTNTHKGQTYTHQLQRHTHTRKGHTHIHTPPTENTKHTFTHTHTHTKTQWGDHSFYE